MAPENAVPCLSGTSSGEAHGGEEEEEEEHSTAQLPRRQIHPALQRKAKGSTPPSLASCGAQAQASAGTGALTQL